MSPQSPFPLSGSRTLLIIDDNVVDRETYKAHLMSHRECDFTFFEAEDAEEGLKLCRSVHLDCVLLDFELPDVDGLEFMERLRDESGAIHVPIIMITGRGSENVAVEAMKRGAMDYIVKSEASPANLLRAIVNAIDRAETGEKLLKERRDRREAENELRESEERFRLLVEGVRDYAIIMMDTGGRIISWNSGARRLLNYHDREILGQHIRVIFTPEDVTAKIPERELSIAASGKSANDDRWHVKNGGERFWASGIVSAIYDELNQLRGYSKILRDMTDSKSSEIRLRDALASRDRFLSVASHELRTPITALKFQTQGLLRRLQRSETDPVAPDELRDLLGKSDQQADRLTTVLNDLLNVSRLNENQLHLTFESIDLSDLIRGLLASHASAFTRSGITVTQQIEEAIRLESDRDRLTQVLSSLLTNAIKYAPRNPVTIRARSIGGEKVEISVQDQGAGIPIAEQERIFERYERAVSASEVSGLGLGLYISREMISALGGTLTVHSIGGRGSTFFIRLPLRRSRS